MTKELHEKNRYNDFAFPIGLYIVTRDSIISDGRYVSINFPDKLLRFFAGSRMEQDYVIPYTGDYLFPTTIIKREASWQMEILNMLEEIVDLFQEKKVQKVMCGKWKECRVC